MKSGWDKYASEKRYIKKGYLRKYCNGSKSRKSGQAGSCDCVQQSREEQEQEIEWLIRSPTPPALVEAIEKEIQWFGKVVELTGPIEYIGEKDESEVRIGEPIQVSGEVSSEVGGVKPSRSRSNGRNEKVRQGKDGKDGRSRKKKG